jgi:undecaprenyl pyrophosphate synthase
MIPVKSKDLLPNAAVALNRPQDEVDAVVRFFYKQARETLSSLPGLKVDIPNLGTFNTNIKTLRKKIERTQRLKEQHPDGSPIRTEFERQLRLMLKLLAQHEDEQLRKLEVVSSRKNQL